MSFSRLIIFMALAICMSCSSEPKSADTADASADSNLPAATPAQQANNSGSLVKEISLPDNGQPAAQPQRPKEPAQNAEGVWHYTCAKGCPGGGGAAQKCATCGELLKHNSAYHTAANQPAVTAQPNVQVQPGAGSPVQIQPPVKNEPPQNAQGVWHFTCGKGCPGGAGKKGPCGTCGTELAHNAAYHNK